LSEELPKRRRRTEVSLFFQIGSDGAHRQARFQISTLVRTAFSMQSAFFDVRQTAVAMRWHGSRRTAISSPLMFDVFQTGGQPTRLFATGE